MLWIRVEERRDANVNIFMSEDSLLWKDLRPSVSRRIRVVSWEILKGLPQIVIPLVQAFVVPPIINPCLSNPEI